MGRPKSPKGKGSFLVTPDGRSWHEKKWDLGSIEAIGEIARGAAVLLVRGADADHGEGRYEPPTDAGRARPAWIEVAVSEAANARTVFPGIMLYTTGQGERLIYLWTDA